MSDDEYNWSKAGGSDADDESSEGESDSEEKEEKEGESSEDENMARINKMASDMERGL
jgi:hypothetical protein